MKKNKVMCGGNYFSIVDQSENGWKLFLSPYETAENSDFLLKNNIIHIITLLHKEQLNGSRYDIHKYKDINYHKYIVADLYNQGGWVTDVSFGYTEEQADDMINLNYKLMELYMHKISDLIEICREKNENVLVHCRSAVSRSPSVIVGYYMIKKNKTLQEAKNLLAIATKNKKFELDWEHNHLWGCVLESIEQNKLDENIRGKLNSEILVLLEKLIDKPNLSEILIAIENKKENSYEGDIILDGVLYEIIKNYAENI